MHLTLIPEEPRVVAKRAKIGVEEAKQRLEEMAKKGVIFRVEEEVGKPMYMADQYVVGIWEFNVNNLNTQLVSDMEEYLSLGPILFRFNFHAIQDIVVV